MSSPYTLPPGKHELTGACALEEGLCTWTGGSAHLWASGEDWTALSAAPTGIDSGFQLQSGMLAGAATYVGFLPSDSAEWAWWADLSAFSDAHPMYGDLLLCTHGSADAYTLFSVAVSGLEKVSTFSADDLADPVAGWSAPTNPERLLLLGDGGLWALSPPYTASDLQHLVSFDNVELPASEEIPGPFQPGRATVVIPRCTRTALRLDLSDGSGHATGLAHLPGGAALWNAYLQDDHRSASRLLTHLTALPAPAQSESLRLHDVLTVDGSVQALATSVGIFVPNDEFQSGDVESDTATVDLAASPLDGSILATWGLWLDRDGALEAACRRLCNTHEPDYALVESLRVFAGATAVDALFDLLRSDDPPAGPEGRYAFPKEALRALVAPYGTDAASVVASALSGTSVPARVAACAAAGTTSADLDSSSSGENTAATPVLWDGDHPLPEDVLLANRRHDHPSVRAAARDTCARLSIAEASSSPASS